ncbi:MAG: hypothetical protein Q8R29_01570 [bacterium]|nr:hypothetical protein [bacterium]
MKKLLLKSLLFSAVFLAIFFSNSHTLAGEAKKDTTSAWQVMIDSDGSEFHFSKYCKIFIPSNKGNWMIQIVVFDVNWKEGTLEQVITIERNEKGHKKVRDQRYLLRPDPNKIWIYSKVAGYDIFRAKYRDKVSQLPENARKIFFDLYETESDSSSVK